MKEDFDFQKSAITFLENGVLYTEMKNGIATQSCLYALDTDDGKVIWKKIINDEILNWSLSRNKIIGYTKSSIFYMDDSGKNYTEIKIENKPVSNIELMDDTHFVYVSEKGIEIVDMGTKKSKIVFPKSFIGKDEASNVQIKYISKQKN